MDRSVINHSIDQYEKGGAKLRQAIAGLSPQDMKAVPIPGKWSTHQVVIHLQDAETALADRMRRVLAHDEPSLLAWDENLFIARLKYDDQSAEDAVQIVEATRRQLARVLRLMPDAAFDRKGIHSERGPVGMTDLLAMAVSHLDHHLKFIAEKRAKLGK